jgi:DNA-directed RNA polymerase beta subunit
MSVQLAERRVYQPIPEPNQLLRQLLGVCGLNPWKGANSASREQMFSSHIGQTLVIKGSTERYCQTGMEREFGKYTWNVKMPHTGQVRAVIDRYRTSYGMDSIIEHEEQNPQQIVVYERSDNKEIGMINLPKYCSQHQYFGFPYIKRPGKGKLVKDMEIPEGEIFLDSPAVTPDGGYKYGAQCNVAYMSIPGVAEDGIVISRDVLDRFTFKTYETRVVEWGSKRFPLNLYGDDRKYKAFPDIGDIVRDDGLLMMLRSYDESLAVVEQSGAALRMPDFMFDKATYVPTGGKVVDIRVHHDLNNQGSAIPEGMDEQPLRYDRARREFYQEILTTYQRLKSKHPGVAPRLTPEFHRLVVEAISVVGKNSTSPSESIKKLYRQAPLDDWRVEFVIEYEITPTIGFKLTDCFGGKGVICKICEPHEMPVDEEGNRADIIVSGESTVNRMNYGRLYEPFINAAGRDVMKRITGMLRIDRDEPEWRLTKMLNQMEAENPQLMDEVWEYLLGFYEICSPTQASWFRTGSYTRSRAEHLASVLHNCKNGLYLFMPPENDPAYIPMVRALQEKYPPVWGPVTYIGNSGQRSVTKNNVRIGSVYIIILEKIADDWTAVSSGKLQHFGVLSQVTNADKYAAPTRTQAIRAWGEAEVRIGVSYAGPKIMADILDRNNNPFTHKHILETLLRAEKPTALHSVVDRNVVPLGGSKPLQLVRHVAQCGGWKFVYEAANDQYAPRQKAA